MDISLADIETARRRISGRVRRTPTYASPALASALGFTAGQAAVAKLECLQLGGSFKLRGVLNRLLTLGEPERRRGVITVSGGNHAIAVALAASQLGIPAKVLMAASTPGLNVEITRRHGAEVVLTADIAEAFRLAEAEAERLFLHPYDDPVVIAGHGTVGLEMLEDGGPLTHVFISIGGGGFMAGVAAAIKTMSPQTRVFGVEPERAATMAEAIAAGKPVPIQPSSIIRTLGAPFATERTLAAGRAYLQEIVLVSDEDATHEVGTLLATERVLCEPAAAAVVAAARAKRHTLPSEARVGLVLCGSNVAVEDAIGWCRM